jgi:hypothetical protein
MDGAEASDISATSESAGANVRELKTVDVDATRFRNAVALSNSFHGWPGTRLAIHGTETARMSNRCDPLAI